MAIKAVIFDWGRTIYDKENEALFPETKETLGYCSKKYPLAIVSLAVDNDIEGRFSKLDRYDIRKYFKLALFHISDKDSLFRNAVGNLGCSPEEVAVVDDRMRRLAWPIKHGCTVLWLCRGKFANELPDEASGKPTHTISSLDEVKKIL